MELKTKLVDGKRKHALRLYEKEKATLTKAHSELHAIAELADSFNPALANTASAAASGITAVLATISGEADERPLLDQLKEAEKNAAEQPKADGEPATKPRKGKS